VLIFIVGSYFVLRVSQKLPQIKSYFNYILNTVFASRNKSYDEKMVQLIGPSYLIFRNINVSTPKNSIICMQYEMPDIDSSIAAYFLYPRIIRKIGELKVLSITNDISKNCNYLILYKGYPKFDVKIKEVILFGNNLKDENTVIVTNNYHHSQTEYLNKVGTLHI
jgi:hypothetical protein